MHVHQEVILQGKMVLRGICKKQIRAQRRVQLLILGVEAFISIQKQQ